VLDSSTSLPVCKVADGEACESDGACATGHCQTFFVDADGDGFGTAESGRICATIGAPAPAGYSATTGDCCDIDTGANPAVPGDTYFEFADACGSFDWNCDGTVEQRMVCPGNPTLACGADCIVNAGIIAFKYFTQACH
jgi:hypothetical protein